MLNVGVPVDSVDELGMAALRWAAVDNRTDVIEVLLKHDASANIKDGYGRTPIDLARDRNNKAAVRLLKRH